MQQSSSSSLSQCTDGDAAFAVDEVAVDKVDVVGVAVAVVVSFLLIVCGNCGQMIGWLNGGAVVFRDGRLRFSYGPSSFLDMSGFVVQIHTPHTRYALIQRIH